MREREERKEREKELEEIRRKKDEEEAKLEREQEEEEKRKREEQERREYEEYLKLKETFQIEEEGYDEANDNLNSQNLLQQFVSYIKQSKVVILEDLAAEFKLKTQV
jgi:DDRGK domain-containing protein 1